MNLQKSLLTSFFIFFIPAIFHSTIHDPMRKTVNTNIKPHISIYVWLLRASPLTSQCNIHCIHLYIKPKSLIKLLPLIGGQVELNPGPVKYPCGICTKAVKTGQRGVAFDKCDIWYHTSCMFMTTPEYIHLANTSTVWICSASNTPHSSIYKIYNSSISVLCLHQTNLSINRINKTIRT